MGVHWVLVQSGVCQEQETFLRLWCSRRQKDYARRLLLISKSLRHRENMNFWKWIALSSSEFLSGNVSYQCIPVRNTTVAVMKWHSKTPRKWMVLARSPVDVWETPAIPGTLNRNRNPDLSELRAEPKQPKLLFRQPESEPKPVCGPLCQNCADRESNSFSRGTARTETGTAETVPLPNRSWTSKALTSLKAPNLVKEAVLTLKLEAIPRQESN